MIKNVNVNLINDSGETPLLYALTTASWITCNLHPFNWYPDLDEETRNALLRRLQITVFE